MRKAIRATEVPGAAEAGSSPVGSFTDHLEELRRRILVVTAVFVVCSIAAFSFADPILDALEAPARNAGAHLAALRPQDLFLSRVRASLAVGLLCAIPAFLVELRAFVGPALVRRERRLLDAGLVGTAILSAVGLAMAAFVLVPFMARFFMSFGAGRVESLWSLDSWYALAIGAGLGAALAFEAPLVLVLLFAAGVLDPKVVAGRRREAVVGIFVLAAIATPPDALSQLLVGVPLWLLFELSLVAGRALRPRIARAKELP